MASSGTLHRVALVRTDVSEELSALATQRNIIEDGILHSHFNEIFKSYLVH
jgi:hypothetical protein